MPFWDEFQLAFMRHAERAPMVEWYEARPTTMLGMLPFEYIPSFELATGRGEMVVEISEPGMPTSDEEAWRVAEICELLEGSDTLFAQLTTYEASRRKIFGRSQPLRPRTNDYWLRDNRAIAASFWEKFKSPWNTRHDLPAEILPGQAVCLPAVLSAEAAGRCGPGHACVPSGCGAFPQQAHTASHPLQPAAPHPRATRRLRRETDVSHAAHDQETIQDAAYDTDMVSADPGSDLACRIEPLSDDDWKEINSKIDRRYGGFFVSGVNQKVLPWRGEHQLAALSVFEMDPGIDAFEVSPERVTLMVAGKTRSYVPAYWLRRGSATVMVDVLHRRQETHPLRPVITATITAGYARIGVHYRVLPEKRLFAQPRYRNARFVLGHRGLDTRAETELAVVRVLGRTGRHDVASVTAALPDIPDARETLLALAARRRVRLGLWAQTIGGMQAELISWGGLS